jgi:polyphenol oxidase
MSIHADWLRPDWPLDHVRAFMTTRAGGISLGTCASMNVGRSVGDDPLAVAHNRGLIDAVLGAPAVFVWQVHGAEVLRLRPEHVRPGIEAPQADAAISTTPGLGLAIQAADCLPVLFAAPGGVGGAHAGWRGLAAGVLENTVAALSEAAGCAPQDIHAWMGACIGPEAFEVGEEVLRAFGATPSAADPALFRFQANSRGEPRWRANLATLARQRLLAAGLTQISGGHWCTYSEDSRFFSFRRERLSGRMAAVIRLL